MLMQSAMDLEQGFQLGDLVVRPLEGTILRSDGPLRVQPRAMDLLVCLARHAGQVVARDELIEDVWPRAHVGDEALTRCISVLRQALGELHNGQRYIETVPKRGYRLEFAAAPLPTGIPDDSAAVVAEGRPSLAVLPFSNNSSDTDNEYFSDGITDELIDAFARIPGLKVIARTSVFAFKGKQIGISEIGAKLGVGYVLAGSVRKSGNRLRINAELVDVADQSHLWTEQYDRNSGDIFEIQEDIARAMVGTLTPHLKIAALVVPTARLDPAAYDALLEGRFLCNRHTEENLLRAVQCFERALALDPACAPAYAGLARVYIYLASHGHMDLAQGARKGAEYVQRALAIDDTLAEAHYSLAMLRLYFDWDLPAAESAFRAALELNPGDAVTLVEYALYLACVLRGDEAAAAIDRALELDPLSALAHMRAVQVMIGIRDFDAAERFARRGLVLDPTQAFVHGFNGMACYLNGARERALRFLMQEPEMFVRLSGLIPVYHAMGRAKEAEAALDELIAKRQSCAAWQICVAFSILGDRAGALAWLERALAQRDPGLVYLQVEPGLDPIRDDPRFLEVRRQLGFSTLEPFAT